MRTAGWPVAALLAAASLFAATFALAKAPTPLAGERLFQRCYSCHSLDKAEDDLSGPNLDRLIGKRIAADPRFAYSPAFRRFAARHQVWSRALLDRFIADPEAVVPENSMGYFGMPRAEDRAALIAYIAADR